jgi:hypothetical protein
LCEEWLVVGAHGDDAWEINEAFGFPVAGGGVTRCREKRNSSSASNGQQQDRNMCRNLNVVLNNFTPSFMTPSAAAL